MFLNNSIGHFQGLINVGLQLANLSESEGGWAEYFGKTDEADLSIADDMLRAHTAILLENAKRWMASMAGGAVRRNAAGHQVIDEAVRSVLLGGMSDYLLPTIRSSFPTNPINDIFSTQPTMKRHATIFMLDFVAGTTKGGITAGQKLTDAFSNPYTGFAYTSESIDSEVVAQLGSAGSVLTGCLKYHDGGGVRPGTVTIKANLTVGGTNKIFYDNGQGAMSCTGVYCTGTVDYRTGIFTITLVGHGAGEAAVAADTFTTAAAVATYRYNSEGSSMSPEIDIQTTSTSMETVRRSVKVNFSAEATQDAMAELGVSIEPLVVSGASDQLALEQAYQIIYEAWAVADVAGSFADTPENTAPVTRLQHFGDLKPVIGKASGTIETLTGVGYGNILIVDDPASVIVSSMPGFKAAPAPASRRGLYLMGTLDDQYKVYKFVHLTKFPGAAAKGNILVTYKGNGLGEASVVWAPYQLLYTTDTLQTPDFISKKGFAHRSAIKVVNRNMIKRISIT